MDPLTWWALLVVTGFNLACALAVCLGTRRRPVARWVRLVWGVGVALTVLTAGLLARLR